MYSRGVGGGSRVVNKRPRQGRKKQCELGSSCPYQHEYQHQLEFAHDGSNTAAAAAAGSSTPAAGGGRRVRGGDTGGRAINPVNGTGSRGRKVAVAADRRRAERTLRKEVGVGQDPLDVHGDGAREAQRTRWVMQKQQEIEQQQQQQQRPRTANSAARGTERGGLSNTVACSGTSGLSPSSSDSVQPVLSPSRTISHASSPSSFRLCHLASGSASDSALPQAGRRSSSTAGRKRAAPGTSNEQRGARREQGRDHGQEVICINSDTDDE